MGGKNADLMEDWLFFLVKDMFYAWMWWLFTYTAVGLVQFIYVKRIIDGLGGVAERPQRSEDLQQEPDGGGMPLADCCRNPLYS